jgi:hypothetical protein
MAWIKGLVVALLVVALLAAVVAAYGNWRWESLTRELSARLDGARATPAVRRYDSAAELSGLPAPVQRYFRAVLREGQPIVTAIRLEHRGTFNMSQDGEQWVPFTSVQHVVTRRPGFVWDARMPMAPGLGVRVHDAYVAGEGILHAALFGAFTVMRMRGTPELARGELMRFFAEAAWYPTALLPSQGVRWGPIDDHSARATLADGDLSLELTFGFAPDGTMRSVRADARGRTVGEQTVMTPWEGQWFDFEWRDGLRVPTRGEVAWLLPEGRKPYWRGTVSAMHVESAP